jgi:TatA/E family protein of Tat protein translocase
MPEILLILVIALIVFGPRKLPELGKSLGQSLAQFRRASEDFKRQWEDEVDLERRRIPPPSPPAGEPSSAAEAPASTHAEELKTSELDEHAPAVEAAQSPTTVHREASVGAETKRDWM